jgi:signal transduction histidine kinase
MFGRMSIKVRIIVSITLLLLMYTGGILYLDYRVEKKLSSTQFTSSQPLPYNSFLSMVLFGDSRSSLMMGGNYTAINGDGNIEEFSAIVRTLRYQILIVLGFFIVLGVILALCIARGITKPIMDLADASRGMTKGRISDKLESPKGSELKVLTESFKHMQEGLLEYEEEKSRSEGVEITKHLAAGIAHEIKNPINTVGLIADYLQTNLSPDDPEKRYEFYKLSENMKNELKRINRIVEGFLRLTKPDLFNFKIEDINKIIRDTVSILEPEIIKNGVKLSLNLHDGIPPVKADRDKLNQVFSNLLINAVEAMPRGGNIEVSTEKLGGEIVRVEISDTGIGIPKEDKSKIFSPYYTTKKQGFGLGLSLIHNIVQKHSGKINVNSNKGGGARFEILLPVSFSDE